MKINIILLGAGNSERFGSNKLLYEIDGKPMYAHVVSSVLDAIFGEVSEYVGNIFIVSHYEEIKQGVEKLPITYIENTQSELGISHSIHLGINADSTADGYFFMVCDQPYITSTTIFRLLVGYLSSGKEIGCIAKGDRRGNPCIFHKKHLPELLKLKGDCGGREIRERYIESGYQLQIEAEIELDDIDYSADEK